MENEKEETRIDLLNKQKKLEDEKNSILKEEKIINDSITEEEERIRLQKKELEDMYDSTDDAEIRLIIVEKLERIERSQQKRRSLLDDIFADISDRTRKNSKASEDVAEELKLI